MERLIGESGLLRCRFEVNATRSRGMRRAQATPRSKSRDFDVALGIVAANRLSERRYVRQLAY
jgi:hypothetical protein